VNSILVGLVLTAANAFAVYFFLGKAIDWLALHALARPNHRSSHASPTPQGAGLVLIPVALVGFGAGFALDLIPSSQAFHLRILALAAVSLMLVGFLDDRRVVPVAVRLAAQSVAALAVIASLPADARLVPFLPYVADRLIAFLALLWFVNAMNFMDGIDLMSGVETIALTVGIIALTIFAGLPTWLGICSAALLGATLGFLPWNAPPARVFLGDAGSLPLGLILGTLLMHVASSGAYGAALILPGYYLADASLTLLGRLWRREIIWKAHREHAYQRAHQHGWSVQAIVTCVAMLNMSLIALAVAASLSTGVYAGMLLFVAMLFVGVVFLCLSARKPPTIFCR
jgi:UDP-N-acetylmuramyl pentapeptide phosphotransferase/UDP-N-acetylglucosamine-1-phosphate transferase